MSRRTDAPHPDYGECPSALVLCRCLQVRASCRAVGLFLPLHVAAAVDAKAMCRCGSRSVVGY
ncbi:MAG: hypothetical protein KIC78_02870 [Prevotella sp.]|uniref:hypothetical protein n=1 Tax=Prevotella sp. TaxID=59823 RepID=UPI00258070F1|nr:hypothetical protein [Prevotella sp.]MBS5875099.1 hypothetical protein [Prevotella sp.]